MEGSQSSRSRDKMFGIFSEMFQTSWEIFGNPKSMNQALNRWAHWLEKSLHLAYNNKKPVNFLTCPNLFGEFQGLEGQLTGW